MIFNAFESQHSRVHFRERGELICRGILINLSISPSLSVFFLFAVHRRKEHEYPACSALSYIYFLSFRGEAN